MEYRALGRTDLEVSAICLGTMTFGEQNSEADAFAQMDLAFDAGVNFFDTAEIYSIPPRAETHGLTEQIVGSWIKARGCRDRIVIATKVAGPGRDWLPYIRGGNNHLDRANIEQACEDSLRRLQTDVIDLYQVHWPERENNRFGQLGYPYPGQDEADLIEETLATFADLVRAGKVRYIGLSNETPWGVAEYLRLAERLQLPRILSIQNPYNLLNRTFEIGLSEFAHREQVGLLAYSPLAFGVLSGKYLHGARPSGSRLALFPEYTRYSNAEALAATGDYVALARRHDLDPAQMALAFVTGRPFVTSNIIGATRLSQLASNLASIELRLGDELLDGIEAIHVRHPNPSP